MYWAIKDKDGKLQPEGRPFLRGNKKFLESLRRVEYEKYGGCTIVPVQITEIKEGEVE